MKKAGLVVSLMMEMCKRFKSMCMFFGAVFSDMFSVLSAKRFAA